jgi:hypothetical protein
MFKRLFPALICIAVVFSVQTVCHARFTDFGGWSREGNVHRFMFDTRGAVLVYSDAEYDNFSYPIGGGRGIRPGSALYIPILTDNPDENRDSDVATIANLRLSSERVTLSHRATRFVVRAEIYDVGANEAERFGLSPGAHLRVEFSPTLESVSHASFSAQFVLVFNGIADQQTMIRIEDFLLNRDVTISSNSVHSVLSPTVFITTSRYSGEAVFDFGDGIRYSTHVGRESRHYLALDTSPIQSVQDMSRRTHMRFYSFPGDFNTFERVGTLEIPIDREAFRARRNDPTRVFVYKYTSGSLTAIDPSELSFDSERDVLTIRTRTLENYVLSAAALLREVDESADNIIQSGYAPDPTREPPAEPGAVPGPPPEIPDANFQNPETGGRDINATNQAANNPNTSDNRVLWPFIALCALSAAVLLLRRYKIHVRRLLASILCMALVVGMSAPAMATGGRVINMQEEIFGGGFYMNGMRWRSATGSRQLEDLLEIKAGTTIFMAFSPRDFAWDGMNPMPAMNMDFIRQHGITVTCETRNADGVLILDSVRIEEYRGMAGVMFRFADTIASFDAAEFELKGSVNLAGGGGSGFTLEGSLSNRSSGLITRNTTSVRLGPGRMAEIYSFPTAAVRFDIGAGITLTTAIQPGGVYEVYAVARELPVPQSVKQHRPSIEKMITVETINLSGGQVTMNLEHTYYIYSVNFMYLGTSDDSLPHMARYYLSKTKF